VGEIGTKGGHLAGRSAVHMAGRPPPLAELPLSPRIPYLQASSDTCVKGLTHLACKLGRLATLHVSLGRAFLSRLLHVL
jgi:hypothetical protein